MRTKDLLIQIAELEYELMYYPMSESIYAKKLTEMWNLTEMLNNPSNYLNQLKRAA